MADEIRSLSDELAGHPGSLAFLKLGELLRQRRELDAAERVVMRGRERHPGLPAAHDLAARIAVDRGKIAEAADAWRAVLRLDPSHPGAHKGLGFIAYRDGKLREASAHLAQAAAANPDDSTIATALATVQSALQSDRPAPPAVTPLSVPRQRRSSIGAGLFGDLASGSETVLLVDENGLVLAGSAPVEGVDRSAEIGAHLSGVSEEADRAMRHLGLGAWTAIVIEAPETSAALSPTPNGGLVMIAAPHSTPLGLLRRTLERAAERARVWLGTNDT